MRVLIVEDDPELGAVLTDGLREQAIDAVVAPSVGEGRERALFGSYDEIVLDVLLPGGNGYDLCRELRARDIATPILMLTARDAVDDRVRGLDAGADDYLTKPFAFKELLARLRALSRRAAEIRPEVIRVGDLALNTANHAVNRSGKSISLTAKEYALLEFLMLNQNRIVGREQIAQHVWDENFDPFSNIIDVYVRRLRTKIDVGFERPLLHTRRGEGYMLTAEAVTADD